MGSGSLVETPDRRYRAGSVGELLDVAIPLMISSGSVSLMHSIDRVFLSWYSQEALAASMPAGLLNWMMMSFAFGTVLYVNSFVAQYHGAGRKDRVAASVWQGVWMAVVFGIVLAIIAPFVSLIYTQFGHDPEIIRLETRLFMIYSLGSAVVLSSTALSAFFSGRGAVKVVMWANILAMVVNICLDYCLIFGIEGVVPEGGVTGAGIATICGYLFSCSLVAGLIAHSAWKDGYPFASTLGFDRELMGRMLKHGFPTGVQMAVDISGFMMFLLVVGGMGIVPLAATNLAFSLNSLTFIPMMGLGIAVSTLVGQRIGERRPHLASRTVWLAFGIAMVYMTVWSIGYVAFPDLLLSPYLLKMTESVDEIRDLCVILLRFVTVYTLFDGLATVFGGAIRGAGDTRFPMHFTIYTSVGLLLVPMILIKIFGGSIYLSWGMISVYIMTLGLGLFLRFLGGQWKTMTVMEQSVIDTVSLDMESPAEHVAELTVPVHVEPVIEEEARLADIRTDQDRS